MKRSKMQKKQAGSLLPLLKSRKESMKFKRLYVEKCIICESEKRRAEIERMKLGYYAGLVEWLNDYALTASTMEEFDARKTQYQEIRKSQMQGLKSKLDEKRILYLFVGGKTRRIKVY